MALKDWFKKKNHFKPGYYTDAETGNKYVVHRDGTRDPMLSLTPEQEKELSQRTTAQNDTIRNAYNEKQAADAKEIANPTLPPEGKIYDTRLTQLSEALELKSTGISLGRQKIDRADDAILANGNAFLPSLAADTVPILKAHELIDTYVTEAQALAKELHLSGPSTVFHRNLFTENFAAFETRLQEMVPALASRFDVPVELPELDVSENAEKESSWAKGENTRSAPNQNRAL